MSNFDKFLKEKQSQPKQTLATSATPPTETPKSAPSLPQAARSHSKWLPIYAATSAVLILALVGVLIFKHFDTIKPAGIAAIDESISDTKTRTTELEKQRETQAMMLEQQRLAAETETKRQEQEMRRRAALTRIEDLEGQLSVVRRTLASVQAEKAVHGTQLKSYAMDHKMVIAALGITVGGAGVALDNSDQFSGDQKAVAAVSAVVAGLYAVSNHEECIEVADRMAKAAVIQADYDSRISEAQRQISAFQAQIAKGRSALEEK